MSTFYLPYIQTKITSSPKPDLHPLALNLADDNQLPPKILRIMSLKANTISPNKYS